MRIAMLIAMHEVVIPLSTGLDGCFRNHLPECSLLVHSCFPQHMATKMVHLYRRPRVSLCVCWFRRARLSMYAHFIFLGQIESRRPLRQPKPTLHRQFRPALRHDSDLISFTGSGRLEFAVDQRSKIRACINVLDRRFVRSPCPLVTFEAKLLIEWQCPHHQHHSNRLSHATGLRRCHMVHCPRATLE